MKRNPYNHIKGRLAHVVIAEAALGSPLPKGAEVHHANYVKYDNAPSNLVICQDRAYHQLLHRRTDALDAVGNPNALKCKTCQQWNLEDVNEMRVMRYFETRSGRDKEMYEHGACNRARQLRERRNRSKA